MMLGTNKVVALLGANKMAVLLDSNKVATLRDMGLTVPLVDASKFAVLWLLSTVGSVHYIDCTMFTLVT